MSIRTSKHLLIYKVQGIVFTCTKCTIILISKLNNANLSFQMDKKLTFFLSFFLFFKKKENFSTQVFYPQNKTRESVKDQIYRILKGEFGEQDIVLFCGSTHFISRIFIIIFSIIHFHETFVKKHSFHAFSYFKQYLFVFWKQVDLLLRHHLSKYFQEKNGDPSKHFAEI